MEYDKKIIDICTEKTAQQISKTVDIRTLIDDATNFLNITPKVTYTTRVYCVLNNIHEIPKCKKCGKNCTPNKYDAKLGFTEYCSSECSRSDKTIDKDKESKLEDYDWLYNERITLKKSKEQIAIDLGVSTTPVNKWIKFHNIAKVRYNCANASAMAKISDKDWMYNQYKVQKKKCEDIGNELGISKSTVSLWLVKHEIESNPTNSYDREHVYTSKECQEVIDYIKTVYQGEIKINDRKILNGFELDILLPEKKIAIEYNGVYSHLYRPEESSISAKKDMKYHVHKTDVCIENGIQLIHIFSDSWKSKSDIWKSYIKNKIGLTSKKVYARKCKILEIDTGTKSLFLNENHLQGNDCLLYTSPSPRD